ncbi:DUF2807 domain-containing protein [Sphingomonas sp.]|uniref:GIN domain-containing protein n=1 Tax=Sphingomonas sp. TaxID=28214 RepID=UPI001EB212F7|nr:DUF2807 domain-containing protein [Sphingomonas sp.]MBX3594787.1 DUF2807 domain-containing protein [Sphingomonas sp.]
MRLRRVAAPLLLPAALLAATAAPPAAAPDERRIMLTGYERIRVDGPFKVRVIGDGPPSATISGERRAIDRISVRNQGGTLIVGIAATTWDGWREKEGTAIVTLSARGLRAANVNGGGALEIDAMRGQRIDLGVNGSGSLAIGRIEADQLVTTLTGTGAVKIAGGSARNARFSNFGAGSIDAGAMPANDLWVNSQSAGDSSFAARFTAEVTVLGTGKVIVAGNATCRLAGPGPAACAGKTERRR